MRHVIVIGVLLIAAATVWGDGPAELAVATEDAKLLAALHDLKPQPIHLSMMMARDPGGGLSLYYSRYRNMKLYARPPYEDGPPHQTLLKAGPRAARVIEAALAKVQSGDPRELGFCLLLGEVGDDRTLRVLADQLAQSLRDEKSAAFAPDACIQALWLLTGRTNCPPTVAAWQEYVKAIEPGFVPARLRKEFKPSPDAIGAAMKDLADPDKPYAADRAILMGTAMEESVASALAGTKNPAIRQRLFAVLDELGRGDRIPADERVGYYVGRLLERPTGLPEGAAIVRRIIASQTFPVLCQVVIEAQSQMADGEYFWNAPELGGDLRTHLGRNLKEFGEASDALKAGLAHDTAIVRKATLGLVQVARQATLRRPDDLYTALETAWRREADPEVQMSMAAELGAMPSAQGARIAQEQLRGNDPGLLAGAAFICQSLLDRTPDVETLLKPYGEPAQVRRAMQQRLLELTAHDAAAVRLQSLRTLRLRWYDDLLDHLPRLARDDEAWVRVEVGLVIGQCMHRRDEQHTEILKDLLKSEDVTVLQTALEAAGKRRLTGLLGTLLELVDHPRVCHEAVAAINQYGGPLGLAALVDATRSARVGGYAIGMLNHRTQVTHKTPAAWRQWLWDYEQAMPRPGNNAAALTRAQADALWNDLCSEPGLAAMEALERLGWGGPEAIAAVSARLAPVKFDAEAVQRDIDLLASGKFAERNEAFGRLQVVYANGIHPELVARALLNKDLLAEARTRLERLQAMAQAPMPELPALRGCLRAIRLLEWDGGEAARKRLIELGGGAEGARLTKAAREALERLKAGAREELQR